MTSDRMNIHQVLKDSKTLLAIDAEREATILNILEGPFSDDASFCADLGWHLHRAKLHLDANKFFARMIRLPCAPGLERIYGLSFSQYCHNIFVNEYSAESIDFLERECEASLAVNGPRPWTSLYLGAVTFKRGQESRFYDHFADCARLGDLVRVTDFGSYTLKDDAFVAALIAAPVGQAHDCEPSSDDVEVDETDQIVLAASCDTIYFENFGTNFFRAVAENYPKQLVHLNIVNASDDALTLKDTLRAAYPNTRINISLQNANISQYMDRADRKAFYTTGRFLNASYLLKKYQLPLIITEFDAVLSRDVSNIVDLLRGVDVGIIFYDHNNHFPWNHIWAGTVYIANTEGGRLFAEGVGRYCAAHLVEKPLGNLWHVDQNALYAVHKAAASWPTPPIFADLHQIGVGNVIKHHGGLY